jgi:acetyl-CoA carboxylase biotin carboxyl carrier protein
MDIRKVRKLIELLEESGLSEIEITEGDDKVRISKQTTVSKSSNDRATSDTNDIDGDIGQPDTTTSLPKNSFHEIKAPMIGTYYQASEHNAEAFVKVGDPVSEGDTLCIIEAMKMMNKIGSDIDGVIERILVQNGDPVEYDEVLFLISK